MIDFDALAEKAETSLQRLIVQIGRELGDVLQYGSTYRRGAREHFAEAWRFAQATDDATLRHARREMILAVVYGGKAACGHDIGRWYVMPHTPEQKALPAEIRYSAVAYCQCGAFYQLAGIDIATNPRPRDWPPKVDLVDALTPSEDR